MGLNYQKYINRLKQKRQDNPEYALYKQSMQAMAEPMKQMNRTMQGQMAMAGGSIGAIGSTYLQGQSAMQNLAMQSFGAADRSAITRNDALDNQITQMEMTRDAEEERKKNELTKSLITGAATVGGFALGGLGAPLLGGAAKVATDSLMPGTQGIPAGSAPEISPVIAGQGNTDLAGALANSGFSGGSGFNLDSAMLGSQIGAGIGGIGSSFVGGADYNALQQSIGDTLAGISSISTLKTHREFLDTFREKYPMLTSEQDKETFLTMLTLGDYQGAMNLLQGLQAPTAEAEVVESGIDEVEEAVDVQAAPVAKNESATIGESATITEPEPDKEVETAETEQTAAGTGKTYEEWQGMINNGDTSGPTIKMAKIEQFKKFGYWYDAKGKKKTTKPPDYDKYYGGK